MLSLPSHNAGFFSTCSVKLNNIIDYVNKTNKIPDIIKSYDQFTWYNPNNSIQNITAEYFTETNEDIEYSPNSIIIQDFQFTNYKVLNYSSIIPFIRKYYSPSAQIVKIQESIEDKYNIIYENTCVLFYRGNDKCTETKLCSYDEIIEKAKLVQHQNPKIVFLIQSDETEFIKKMQDEFPNSFYFKDEIRHINKCIRTVDHININENFHYSKNYLAITIIMSKCKTIICGSGNCSIWIMYYRGNADNVYQHLIDEWIIPE